MTGSGVELTCLAIAILRKLENIEKRIGFLEERLRDTERVVQHKKTELREVVQQFADVADACEVERRHRELREGSEWLNRQPLIPYTR